MKSPVWHRYHRGVHHYWGLLFSPWGILHLRRYREGRYVATKLRGIIWCGGSLQLLNYYKRKRRESTSRIHLSYYIRRPVFKLTMATRLFWRYLTNQDIKMCVMCGESFATTEMFNPNYDYDELGEPKKLKVCNGCPVWVRDTQAEGFRRFLEEYNRKVKSHGAKVAV